MAKSKIELTPEERLAKSIGKEFHKEFKVVRDEAQRERIHNTQLLKKVGYDNYDKAKAKEKHIKEREEATKKFQELQTKLTEKGVNYLEAESKRRDEEAKEKASKQRDLDKRRGFLTSWLGGNKNFFETLLDRARTKHQAQQDGERSRLGEFLTKYDNLRNFFKNRYEKAEQEEQDLAKLRSDVESTRKSILKDLTDDAIKAEKDAFQKKLDEARKASYDVDKLDSTSKSKMPPADTKRDLESKSSLTPVSKSQIVPKHTELSLDPTSFAHVIATMTPIPQQPRELTHAEMVTAEEAAEAERAYRKGVITHLSKINEALSKGVLSGDSSGSLLSSALDLIPSKGKGKLAGKGIGALAKAGAGLGKGALRMAKVAGPVGLAITAGMAAMDAYDGYNDDNAIKQRNLAEGKDPNAEITTKDRLKMGAASAVSGLSFGLIGKDSIMNTGERFTNLFTGKGFNTNAQVKENDEQGKDKGILGKLWDATPMGVTASLLTGNIKENTLYKGASSVFGKLFGKKEDKSEAPNKLDTAETKEEFVKLESTQSTESAKVNTPTQTEGTLAPATPPAEKSFFTKLYESTPMGIATSAIRGDLENNSLVAGASNFADFITGKVKTPISQGQSNLQVNSLATDTAESTQQPTIVNNNVQHVTHTTTQPTFRVNDGDTMRVALQGVI